MRRTELMRVKDLQTSIDALEALLQDLRDSSLQSPGLEDKGSTPTRNISSNVEQTVLKMEKTEEKLLKRKQELSELKTEITDFIVTVKDPILASILSYRFILGYSWSKTASLMHTTEDSIKKVYQRAIKK